MSEKQAYFKMKLGQRKDDPTTVTFSKNIESHVMSMLWEHFEIEMFSLEKKKNKNTIQIKFICNDTYKKNVFWKAWVRKFMDKLKKDANITDN